MPPCQGGDRRFESARGRQVSRREAREFPGFFVSISHAAAWSWCEFYPNRWWPGSVSQGGAIW